jgi:hypothetical protein
LFGPQNVPDTPPSCKCKEARRGSREQQRDLGLSRLLPRLRRRVSGKVTRELTLNPRRGVGTNDARVVISTGVQLFYQRVSRSGARVAAAELLLSSQPRRQHPPLPRKLPAATAAAAVERSLVVTVWGEGVTQGGGLSSDFIPAAAESACAGVPRPPPRPPPPPPLAPRGGRSGLQPSTGGARKSVLIRRITCSRGRLRRSHRGSGSSRGDRGGLGMGGGCL